MNLQPLDPNIDLAHLLALSSTASEVLEHARTTMLAPSSQKHQPVFSTLELAELCGVEKTKILYAAKKGHLPAGTKIGSKLEWSMEDAIPWIREFRTKEMRNPDIAAAVTITIANFKGGVSKTTTAAILAQGLSRKGHKVLVIDTDPQGSLTTLFGYEPDSQVEQENTIFPLCTGESDSILPSIRKTYWPGIDIVCAAPLLFNAEFLLPSRQINDPSFAFWRVLDSGLDAARSIYDCIIIDTPPSMSYITINSIFAAQGIIMPVPPNALDYASSVQFWNLFTELCAGIEKNTGDSKKFNFLDILLSRVDKADAVSVGVKQWILSAYGNKVLPFEIPKTSTASSSSVQFGTVYDVVPSSVPSLRTLNRARDAYEQFVEHIEIQIQGIWASDAKAMQSVDSN
jgi:chromosome partitioning protein